MPSQFRNKNKEKHKEKRWETDEDSVSESISEAGLSRNDTEALLPVPMRTDVLVTNSTPPAKNRFISMVDKLAQLKKGRKKGTNELDSNDFVDLAISTTLSPREPASAAIATIATPNAILAEARSRASNEVRQSRWIIDDVADVKEWVDEDADVDDKIKPAPVLAKKDSDSDSESESSYHSVSETFPAPVSVPVPVKVESKPEQKQDANLAPLTLPELFKKYLQEEDFLSLKNYILFNPTNPLLKKAIKDYVDAEKAEGKATQSIFYRACMAGYKEVIDVFAELKIEDRAVTKMVADHIFTAFADKDRDASEIKDAIINGATYGVTVASMDDKDNTFLHLAITQKMPTLVDDLLKLPGCDQILHETNKAKQTPLSLAIDNDDVVITKALLNAGAQQCGKYQCTPLVYALRAGADKVVGALLKAKLDVDARAVKDSQLVEDESAYNVVTTLKTPVAKKYAKQIFKMSKSASKALNHAVQSGNLVRAQELLDAGASWMNVTKENQEKWQQHLAKERYRASLKAWCKDAKNTHPAISAMNDKLFLLNQRYKDIQEAQEFLSSLGQMRAELVAAIDKAAKRTKNGSVLSDNLLACAGPVKHVELLTDMMGKILAASKPSADGKALNVLASGAIDAADTIQEAIDDFKKNFKRVYGWKAFGKTLGLILLAAVAFVAVAGACIGIGILVPVAIPVAVTAAAASVAAVAVLVGGAGLFLRRDKLTKGVLKVASKGRSLEEIPLTPTMCAK